jgi:hypothetical protein
VYNSQKNISTLNNYIAQDSSASRYNNRETQDNKNVRFKDEDTFRPVISDPIPNPSINLKNTHLQDLPDLRNLKQQMANANINLNINRDAASSVVPSYYESPQVGSRSSHSARGSHTNSNAQSVDNFENLYSKVSVSSTLKVATTPPSTGSRGSRYVATPQQPQISLNQQQTIQSTASSMSQRYGDDHLPVYINSNFDDDEV